MRADGESGAVEVGNEAFFVGHLCERRFGVGLGELVEQRAGGAYGLLDLPEGVAAVEGFLTTETPFDCAQGRLRHGERRLRICDFRLQILWLCGWLGCWLRKSRFLAALGMTNF